jgi:uncharacterized protein (TIGR02246 family)
MKNIILFALFYGMVTPFIYAQDATTNNKYKQDIESLIDQYSQAREQQDTVLLKSILTEEIDQLVSTGEWRRGMRTAIEGMQRSSSSNPGGRTLTVDNIRFINPEAAIADARYEIQNADGTLRKMWSTFIVVYEAGTWKITAIRNMLPADNS